MTYTQPPMHPQPPTRSPWWRRTGGIIAIAIIALLIGGGIGAASGSTSKPVAAPAPTVTATATATVQVTQPAPPVQTKTLRPTIMRTVATRTHVVTKTYTPPPKPAISDGVYQVGTDINPGTWRTSGGNQCYYAILNSTNTNNIADNNDFTGPQIITLYPGKYFEADGGCQWRHE